MTHPTRITCNRPLSRRLGILALALLAIGARALCLDELDGLFLPSAQCAEQRGVAADVEPQDPSGQNPFGDALPVSGKIIKINALSISVSVNNKSHTYAMAPNVVVTIDGMPARVKELKTGFTAKVTVSSPKDKPLAVRVDAQRPKTKR